MRVVNLASGSKGNCSFIEAGGVRILIDAGLSVVEIERRLAAIGEKAQDIDAIFITHEHVDHVKGFVGFLKKYKARGFIHKQILDKVLLGATSEIYDKTSAITAYELNFHNVKIIPFELPHDSLICLGYMVEYNKRKVAFVTDLGMLPLSVLDMLCGVELIYIESNHDKKMLNNCHYPYIVKQRISGNHGHLSNDQASEIIVNLAKMGTKFFVLSHISENSNTIEQAYLTNAKALENAGFILEKDVFLRYSRQDRPGNNFNFGDNNE